MLNESKVDAILMSIKNFHLNGINLEYICFHSSGEKDNWKKGIKKEDVIKFLPRYYFMIEGSTTEVKSFTIEEVIKLFIPINTLLDMF